MRGTCFIKGKIFDSLNHGEADNSSLAFPSAAERCFFIRFAAWRSVSLRLQSANQKTLTDYQMQRSLFTDLFFDFYFDFRLDFDCTLTGQGGFKTDFV